MITFLCVLLDDYTNIPTKPFYGPVAQTGRALPLQGRGPGFKSRWVHFMSAAPFCRETGVKGKYLNDFPCISNPTSTN